MAMTGKTIETTAMADKADRADSTAQAKSKTWMWSFAEGDGKDKRLLGGKGANLCEMTRIGVNVPPGFVVTTEACLAYLESPEGALPTGVMEQAREQMARLEAATGRRFGGADDPLLVSVRSGSAMSMPGMMDTILNLGLNEESLSGLVEQTGDQRFGYDAYRRLIQLFGKVALGIKDEHFDELRFRKGACRRRRRCGPAGRGPRGDRAALPPGRAQAHRPAVSERSLRAARGRDQGRVRLLDGAESR
jgi:phosphoenolpyruvate synthase/pyruvate phosphate dikinase